MKMLFLIPILLLTACTSNYYECPCNTSDPRLKAYHDIITELVEQRFYNYYLGEDEERLFKMRTSGHADSAAISQEEIRLHNKLFKDSARFTTIYLDTLHRDSFNELSYYETDTSAYSQNLVTVFGEFADNRQQVIDSLNRGKMPYAPKDFSFCTFRLKSMGDTSHQTAVIGKLSVSGIVFNRTADKGLFYYEFRCGDLCGQGGLVRIVKDHDKWKIEETISFWVS